MSLAVTRMILRIFSSEDAYISFKASREDFGEAYLLASKNQCSPNVKNFIVSLYINKLLSLSLH